MTLPFLQTGIFIAAVILTGVSRAVALRLQLLAIPSERSAHTLPTPVGGGLSMVILFTLILLFSLRSGQLPLPTFYALLAGVAVGVVGLIDDKHRLDLRWRLSLQSIAAIWAVWWLGVAPIDFGIVLLANDWLLALMGVLALLWLLNLYNFMDGIDGLAGSELLFVMLMLLILLINKEADVLITLCATLMAAAGGFLVWNWPPAKIFMGDVGSSFIGFTLGILALISMQQGVLTVWTWIILLAVFIVDATLTLGRRCLNGDRWYEGHANHAYQHAARKYKSHGKVTISILVINCLWLAPLAWLSVVQPHIGFYLSLLAMAPLAVAAWKLGAGELPEPSPTNRIE